MAVPPPAPARDSLLDISSSLKLDTNDSQATLRQRKTTTTTATTSYSADSEKDISDNVNVSDKDNDEDITYGKTASGIVFKVPQTHSFLHTLLTTTHRSSLTRLTLFSLLAQPLLFYLLRNHTTVRSVFFLLYFAFWRGCYDWGFAWVLRKQSEKKWVVRWLKNKGWLDIDERGQGGQWAKWWKRELEMKMDDGYKWENVPMEFNAWLMFRQLVDVVLLNDFVSYTCFAWANLHFPPNHSFLLHTARWVFGWSLILFNLWVKMDAHRVVKDYAWYWGDAFWLMVMQHDLVFDGVYEIAPHPMYSVGYAGYYGLSMVVGSYTVLFVSLAAHAAQFAFLLWFENPHIERTYGGGKKPLVSRAPPAWDHSTAKAVESLAEDGEGPTPSATEGETENESELAELPPTVESKPSIRPHRSDSLFSEGSNSTAPVDSLAQSKSSNSTRPQPRRSKTLSMHDLTHRFFRKPVVVLARLDLFRSSDFALVLLVTYALSTLIPPLSPRLTLAGHFLHALLWRLFHSFGLGLLLRAQSKGKWLVRHYLKHYHYPGDGKFEEDDEGMAKEDVVNRATEEAFGNWQIGYNISLVMTYVSFAGLAWKTYHLPSDWTVSGTILRHVLGLSLVALHIWSAVSSYEVLGDFGWLYSDFFLIQQIPSQLAYTGIYRFLNNPERSMGGAAFFGLWLISNSKLVFALALASHLSHWWFLSFVEKPHMQRLYGDRLRKDGGLTKTLKNVAGKTLTTKAGRHGQEFHRVVQEVKGSIEKVEERVTEAVEEFLDHARPMFSDIMHDTKFLLQQSRERMIITRVASDISAYDSSRYSLTLATSSSAPVPRYHVGQPIRVSWTAPSNHSRKDWIGIYRLGSCKSQLVTRISSVGKWMPIYEDEWDGDTYLEQEINDNNQNEHAGEVLFRGEQLPWTPGSYEFRYHHDGKHNVMSRVAPIEIYVAKPENPDSIRAIRSSLLNIVSLSLDSDPTLIPRSAKRLLKDSVAISSPSLASPITGSKDKNVATPSFPANNSSNVAVDSILAPLTATARPNISRKSSDNHTLRDPLADFNGINDDIDDNDEGDPTPNYKSYLRSEGDEPDLGTSPSSAILYMPSLGSANAFNVDVGMGIGIGIDQDHDPDPNADGGYDIEQDDFTIMTELQAKRIASLSEMAFGVDISYEVVVAEANVGALARRVVGARSLLGSPTVQGGAAGAGGT